MLKKQFLIVILLFPSLLLTLFCLPITIHAATFYNCLDKRGNATLSNYPLGGQTCTPIQTYEEKTRTQEKGSAPAAVSAQDRITPVIIRGNSVLVPVTLTYGRNEVPAQLLLDTGATGTTIHTEIADRLSINMSRAKKLKGKVVGGGAIEAHMIRISSLKVGPHTFENHDIFIVPHEGPAAKFDGLLGMDLLRDLKFKLDFHDQTIIWE